MSVCAVPVPPLLPATQAQLSTLCLGLKQAGRQLEPGHGQTLDCLQQLLTTLCQDTGVDILLRLQILEVIELRSLGWDSNPTVENYYKERFKKYGGGSDPGIRNQEVPERKRLSQSPSLSFIPEKRVTETVTKEDFILVKGVKLSLGSTDPVTLAAAKNVLAEFFSREPTAPPQVGK